MGAFSLGIFEWSWMDVAVISCSVLSFPLPLPVVGAHVAQFMVRGPSLGAMSAAHPEFLIRIIFQELDRMIRRANAC